ncbi:MAG: tyrosine-type recombinase/integrase [Acidimicrobiia bacterium]
MRLGEMLGLRWGESTVAPPHPGRGDQRRGARRGHLRAAEDESRCSRVPVPSVVANELATLTDANPDLQTLVFRSPQGAPLRAGLFRQRIWLPATRSADLEGVRIHDLRHTAVALWIAAGANPKEIAVRAGHSSVVTVLDRYGHLYPEAEDRLSDALDAMASG